MKAIICGACKTILGITECEDHDAAQELALAHVDICPAGPARYEQAVIDAKFRQITRGIDL